MSLILAAPLAVQIHLAAALALIPLVVWQLAARKGGDRHRLVGYVFVALMSLTALSSFWISGLRLWGPFSPIHVLSILTLVSLAYAVRARRVGNIRGHKYAMIGVVSGWAGAGVFTLLPGRLLGKVVLGL